MEIDDRAELGSRDDSAVMLLAEHEERHESLYQGRRQLGPRSVFGIFVCIALGGLSGFLAFWDPLGDRPRNIGQGKATAGLFHPIRQLVLVSIDGFRPDYIDRKRPDGSYAAPTLRRLSKQGAFSSMQPIMPSKTFPNHASIATGLFPESTGMVGNTMYNPRTGDWFHLGDIDPKWWHGEPIWVTLRKASPPLRLAEVSESARAAVKNYTTATVFWPGSEVEGRRGDAFWYYDGSVSYDDRVTRTLRLLNGTAEDLGGRSADFVTLYFEGVDHAGHRYGPNSDEIVEEIVRADDAIAMLHAAVPDVNLIIVSDHGMTEISDDRIIELDKAVKPGTAYPIQTAPMLMAVNETAPGASIVEDLNEYFREHAPHAKAYRREDLPERWHLKNNFLVPEVLAVSDIGWMMDMTRVGSLGHDSRALLSVSRRSAKRKPRPNSSIHGTHGFDNREPDMQAIFLASGPAFRRGTRVRHMRAVDVYPLICHMFGAEPAPNNGSVAVTTHILVHPS